MSCCMDGQEDGWGIRAGDGGSHGRHGDEGFKNVSYAASEGIDHLSPH